MHTDGYQEQGEINKDIPVDAFRAGRVPFPFIIISAIFTAELTLMVLMSFAHLPQWVEIVVDPFLLVMILYPMLDFFVFSPQRKHISEIAAISTALREEHTRTEQLVIARTEELQRVNTNLNDALKKMEMREREKTLLTEMVNFLHACKTQEEAYSVIISIATRLFPELSGSLYIYNAPRDFVVKVAHWGKDPDTDHGFDAEECWALRRGYPHQNGVCGMPNCTHFKSKDTNDALCIPLIANGTAIGTMVIQRTRLSSQASGQLVKPLITAQTAAEYIALALSNIQLHEKLRTLSIRDPLTGLFNRRYLEETLEREILRAQRKNSQFALLIMDVDHFKQFNDSYGHDVGDSVLRELGVNLKSSLRGEDIACRYGGEEFVMVMPDIKMDDAYKRAEELRIGTGNITIMDNGRKLLKPVTISIGMALFPDHGESPEALLKAADQALYSAKDTGRNRVVCASSSPAGCNHSELVLDVA